MKTFIQFFKEGKDIDTDNTSKVIIFNNGKILFLQNSWKEWELPGGHCHEKENYTKGAIREVFEETGIRLKAPEKFRLIDKCMLFVSQVKRSNVRLSHEHIDFKWVKPVKLGTYKLSKRTKDYIPAILDIIKAIK